MESWITVIVAAIVAVSSLGAAIITNCFSSRRFKIELGRAMDVEARKRRWEVRSKQLIQLREELAKITAKTDTIIAHTDTLNNMNKANAPEKIINTLKEKIQKHTSEWNQYAEEGVPKQVAFLQYDTELVSKYVEIIDHYKKLYSDTMHQNRKEFKKVWPEVIKFQELINKKLEEL